MSLMSMLVWSAIKIKEGIQPGHYHQYLCVLGKTIGQISSISAELSNYDDYLNLPMELVSHSAFMSQYDSITPEEVSTISGGAAIVLKQWNTWLSPQQLQLREPDDLFPEDDLSDSQFLFHHLLRQAIYSDAKTKHIIYGRRIAMLEDGRPVLVPAAACPGDIICMFAGSEIPYTLRPFEVTSEMAKVIGKGIRGENHLWRRLVTNNDGNIIHCQCVGE